MAIILGFLPISRSLTYYCTHLADGLWTKSETTGWKIGKIFHYYTRARNLLCGDHGLWICICIYAAIFSSTAAATASLLCGKQSSYVCGGEINHA